MLQSLLHSNLGLPTQFLLCNLNRRLPLRWIILTMLQKQNLTVTLGHILNVLRKVLDGVLIGITEVDGLVIISIHECMQSIHQITHVLEGTSLRTISVDRQWLILQSLNNEIAHHTSIIRMHPWSERVENTRYANLNIVLFLIAVHHRLRHALTLIVARSGSDGVHVTPVGFLLGVLFGITINFGSRSEKHAGLDAFGEAEHVDGSHGGCFDGFDRVVLVVWGTGWAGKVIDLVYLEHDGFCDVVYDEAKVGMVQPMLNILLLAREEVIHNDNLMTLLHELVHQMTSNEPRSACHHNLHTLAIG
mmetsp:Transcript_17112/g.24889  ORF Transcript_17112/g.24889 Transcript_17112/m.24889 type:complete len:304 (+) Transcript_17112:811-1722(+)